MARILVSGVVLGLTALVAIGSGGLVALIAIATGAEIIYAINHSGR
jgi:hypothetical protein